MKLPRWSVIFRNRTVRVYQHVRAASEADAIAEARRKLYELGCDVHGELGWQVSVVLDR